jgi:hypothetical protein
MQVECELYVVSGVECTASQQESALKDAQSIQRRNYNACQCLSVKTNAWAMGPWGSSFLPWIYKFVKVSMDVIPFLFPIILNKYAEVV